MLELSKAEAILTEKESALKSVTIQYDLAMKEKRRLTEDAAVCRRKMSIASSLISGLSGTLALIISLLRITFWLY